ncbi:unnamed protein product [Cylicocyclus nassatus]|uniref:Uncharacterized protein n=1 Tax=Cylicocyclus nassatus TaxID=53992 RepID=A0AA36M4U1_CYLNA|nr:unnamed protein product [Cylicocyclus nassatus]
MVKANENIKTKTTSKTTEKGKTINEVTKLTNPPINKPSPSPAPPNKTSGTKLELKLEGFKKISKGQAAYNIKLEATQQSFDETAGPKHKIFGRRGSRRAKNRLAFDANINLHAGKGTEVERELKEDPTAVTTDPPTAKDIGTIDPKEAANYSFLKKDAKGNISTEEEQPAAIPESIMTDFDLFEKSKKILNEDFKKLEEFFGKDKPQAAVTQKKQSAPTAQAAQTTSIAKGVNLKKKSQKEDINARKKRTAASLIAKPMPVLASILKGKMSTRTMSTQKTLPSKEG